MLKLKVPRVDVSLKFIAVFLTLYLSATPIAGFFYIRWSIIAFIVFAIAFFLNRKVFGKKEINAILYNGFCTILAYLYFDERQ